MESKFLDMIHSPKELKLLSSWQLKLLAEEIRHKIISTVSKNGGHLAPSLGVVELTIALHYVLDSPKDRIVWDVGHQSYAHKILTGRNNRFSTLRKLNGISGFPKSKESSHDAFDTGHSSTAISAALGIAKARDLKNENYQVVAVIGDGAMTGGLAFEGLNHAGSSKTDMIVVLNDNKMSISQNVGAMASYLRKMVTNPKYYEIRKKLENTIRNIINEKAAESALNFEDTLRALSYQGMLFKELGFSYYGPIDGHNIDDIIRALRNIKYIKGPVLLHVLTKKGKGYVHAENNKTKFHGISPFNVENGEKIKCASAKSYTEVFSDSIVKLAEKDNKIVAITAAMASGTGLEKFQQRFPQRFFDVGIAEQHAVTFAAGLAISGFKPVVAIYSTFLQRAYDQIVHDVCLQNLPVVFAIDRAGLVGEDGPTHHGVLDISYLRHIPNIVVMAPKDENELQNMLYTAVQHNGPVAIRYPRGCGIGVHIDDNPAKIPIGKSELLKEGTDIAIIALGNSVQIALESAEDLKSKKINAAVINARFAKPLDKKLILDIAQKTNHIITVEENCLEAGFGSAVLELFESHAMNTNIKRIGIPDKFIEHGTQKELRDIIGLTKDNITRTALRMLKK